MPNRDLQSHTPPILEQHMFSQHRRCAALLWLSATANLLFTADFGFPLKRDRVFRPPGDDLALKFCLCHSWQKRKKEQHQGSMTGSFHAG